MPVDDDGNSRGTDHGSWIPRRSYHSMSDLAGNRENRRISWNASFCCSFAVAFKIWHTQNTAAELHSLGFTVVNSTWPGPEESIRSECLGLKCEVWDGPEWVKRNKWSPYGTFYHEYRDTVTPGRCHVSFSFQQTTAARSVSFLGSTL